MGKRSELEYRTWKADVDRDYDRALAYVHTVSRRTSNNLHQLNSALFQASQEYNQVLAPDQASKSILFDVFITLLIFVAPEAAPELIELEAMANVKNAYEASKIGKGFQKLNEKFEKGIVRLKIGEFLSEAREALKKMDEDGEIEEQRSEGEDKIQTGNLVINEKSGQILDLAQSVEDIALSATGWIIQRKWELSNEMDSNLNMFSQVRHDFQEGKLDTFADKKVGRRELEILTKQILYDMLRSYVEQYVSFTIAGSTTVKFQAFGKTLTLGELTRNAPQHELDRKALQTMSRADLPTYRDERYVKGISEKQRDRIYERFGWPKWAYIIGKPPRPPINTYLDLIGHWKAKTTDDYGRLLMFR